LEAFGIQTAALFLVDMVQVNHQHTESWNGTSWTAVKAINTARNGTAGSSGTQTAALAFGGYKHHLLQQQQNLMEWNKLDIS
jgi:hypothetical protein